MPHVPRPDNAFIDRTIHGAERSLPRLEGQIRALEERVQEALRLHTEGEPTDLPKPEQVVVWGVPFARLTLTGTLSHLDRLIMNGKPGFFITANLNYNMLTAQLPELRHVNQRASFIVCDGMPMVWWSRLTGRPLPERVAGSELIYALTHWAAVKGYRVFFLGGAPGVAATAADKLCQRYPGLQVAGVESPPYRTLECSEEQQLLQRIRDSRADIVYVAFGQPKGEMWLERNFEAMGAPACVQVGASFDFVAGSVARAPRWMQNLCLEWLFRLSQEPRRLASRYAGNACFLGRAVGRELFAHCFGKGQHIPTQREQSGL